MSSYSIEYVNLPDSGSSSHCRCLTCMTCSCKYKIPILFSAGIVSAAIGFTLYFMFPTIMRNEITKRLVLQEGTEGYYNWKNIPVPIYLNFYLFTVTNIDEVYSLKSKPALKQMGPYTFREEREKVVLSNNDNGTITYKQIRRWYFEPDRSNGSLDDMITTLNVPMLSAAAKAREIDFKVIYLGLQEAFWWYSSNWFVHKTVREFIFEGYDDPLMDFARRFITLPFDKFGWFYKRNGTDDGIINIFSGKTGVEKVGKIFTWKGQRNVAAYQPPCNMVNGSAGDMWPPFLTKSSKVSMFVPDICRSIGFSFQKEVDIKGVRTYRYYADREQLDNGKYDPSNKCFCLDGTCLPPGVLNVRLCKMDAPAVVSYPHFLYADPMYANDFTGLNPNPEEHQMSLDLVPEMGVPMQVAARMQINIIFEPTPQISQLANITKKIYFPMFWFSETAVGGEDIASQFRLITKTVPTISTVCSLLSATIGIILLIIAAVFTLQHFVQRNARIQSSEEEKVLY